MQMLRCIFVAMPLPMHELRHSRCASLSRYHRRNHFGYFKDEHNKYVILGCSSKQTDPCFKLYSYDNNNHYHVSYNHHDHYEYHQYDD